MASGGPPERPTRPYLSYSEPRPKRGRQVFPSQEAELSLNAELRRSEEEAGHRSLPNNLEWSPTRSQEHSKKKGKHFEQVKLPVSLDLSSPEESSRRKRHTPATAPRTRLPPGTPASERQAMEKLKKQLFSMGRGEQQTGATAGAAAAIAALARAPPTANNERPLPLPVRSPATVSNTLRAVNETEPGPSGSAQRESDASMVDTSQVLTRLNQVRDFMKQATAMLASIHSSGTEEQSVEREQALKLTRLIHHLKQQEKAYLELLHRTVAVEHDSTVENTPSVSVQSLTEEEKSESASVRDEELEGLRQQHSLLQKMLEQQKQLKELQSRQVALLALQRDAEQRLAEAEEGEEDEGTTDNDDDTEGNDEDNELEVPVRDTRDRSASEVSEQSGAQTSAAVASGVQFTPEELQLLTLLRQHKEQWRSEQPDDEKDTDEGQSRRQRKNQQPQSAHRDFLETGSESADNEEAALALADATQERLQLENKLMALQAKKEQMDNLLAELHALRETQLTKESMDRAGGAGASVNVSKEEEDEPLATTSHKLDDDHILEALEVHQKLQKLQDVRDRLKQLRDLIGHYQPNPVPPENLTAAGAPQQQTESEGEEPAAGLDLEGAVGGGASAPGAWNEGDTLDWMLSAGIGDPDLFGKLRQLREARERVMRLKQTNADVQVTQRLTQMSQPADRRPSAQTQTDEESEVSTQTDTDADSAVSEGSSALAWQDDPEFQEKVRKLNNAKRKLRQLQELVKRIQQFPENVPSLPSDLAELSFDENSENDDEDTTDRTDDDDDDDDEEEDDDDDDDGDAAAGATNQAGASVATGRADGVQSASEDDVSLGRRRVLDLEESDQEAAYIRKLLKQKAELEQLQKERGRLLAVQGELARMSAENTQEPAVQKPPKISKKVGTDEPKKQLRRQNTFTVEDDDAGPSGQSSAATQTPFYGADLRAVRALSADSGDPIRPGPTSNALVFSELRRQRELHEEKLKKRRQKLVFERKKKELDNLSEGGTYSVRSCRSGDMDEGFGVSMMSADITTATWGGSTQPSSTQNDSAVSADESDDGLHRQTIPEVEDEYPDGIVQAEEEEEERLDGVAFPADPTAVFRGRERAPRLPYRDRAGTGSTRGGKKRKLTDRAHKGEQERALTFDLGWPRTSLAGRRAPERARPESYTPTEMAKERDERRAWELHCNQLHQEVSGLASLCADLQREQRMLTSALNTQGVAASPLINPAVSNPYQQYQQRQQEAYQGLQTYFTQQHYLTQQQQILQNLNQCYAQLQQQQQDMAAMQQQFQQLFSCSASPLPGATADTAAVPGFQQPDSFSLDQQARNAFSGPVAGAQLSPELRRYQWEPAHNTRPFTAPTESAKDSAESHRFQFTMPSFSVQHHAPSAPSWLTRQSAESSRFVPSVSLPSAGPQPPQWEGKTGAASVASGHARQPLRGHPVEAAAVPASTGDAGSRPVKSYDPDAYTESVPRTTVAPTSAPSSRADVVGRTFPTPLRATAAASLAGKAAGPSQRSAGASLPVKRGTDSVETSSRASSVPGDKDKKLGSAAMDADRVSEAGSEFSLFEALRDSIYSEVATLISLNESRPHFLIELFRELQLLTSDYLRQRALYALQDLVTRFLTEDSVGEDRLNLHRSRFQAWLASNSELTPSETVETSEDDEALAANAVVRAQQITEGIYDYVENVESGSTLSTPASSHTDELNPFAAEGLGDTVIHLDKALSKMREFERLRAEGKFDVGSSPQSTDSQGAAARLADGDELLTSSAGDVGSESSVSDVQYPKIDTQALDHQIKVIMAEVIPYLNEHMESLCSVELLGYVRDLVLSRIKVSQEQEFGRFFHVQLASILQDSLAKFSGKKMKSCCEDILLDMSEILFNELAFYRLMRDLDRNAGPGRRPLWRQDYESGTDTGTGQEGEPDRQHEDQQGPPAQSATEEEDEATEGSAQGEETDDEDEEESSDDSSSEESRAEDELDRDDQKRELAEEQEGLGKSRDDVMAATLDDASASLSEINSVDSEQQQCVKLELSVSESKPFSSTGSGEEDGEESFDDSEARRKIEDYEAKTAAAAAATRDQGDPQHQGSDSDDEEDPREDEPQGAAASPRPSHLQNGQVGSKDEIEVSVDDLPTKLTGLTEADLQTRMAEEQGRTEGAAGLISHLDGVPELAGDPEALREPDSSSRPLNGLDGVDKA